MPVTGNRKKKCKSEAEILRDRLKLEIAGELGLLEKIETDGWGALNAIEAGKIGGILAGRLKETGRETDPSRHK
ncbi:small, acid-soluble spore protein, alpha/beta type [Desulfocucumis palustris]|uniref:small, acid-soluble spore protein, alpha/beta type n=1 Tax=Desulfocucumis palustris TaxID=1898651 RepID=UPI001E5477AE|nr:small, acid-soluble spore protein, alpha/beta type [Desulfocucumis palustris]